jgi:hypothetical protein
MLCSRQIVDSPEIFNVNEKADFSLYLIT